MPEKEYIERNSVIRHLSDEIEECGDACESFRPMAYGTILGLMGARSFVNTLPAADVVEVRHAHWIDRDEKTWCSRCDTSNKQYKPPYCPHCGAKMDGGKP